MEQHYLSSHCESSRDETLATHSKMNFLKQLDFEGKAKKKILKKQKETEKR